MRSSTPIKDIHEELEDRKGVIGRRILKKDRQEKLQYTKRIIWDLHRRWTDKKSLKIQKE
jgi:hypothetical protein